LDHNGVDVVEAENGYKAVTITGQDGREIVIMDWEMPGMNGLEATGAIRATGRNMPIIALTTRDRPEDIQACLAAGMNGHISKGEDIDRLEEKLLDLLRMQLAE
jgi:CheY-like chemotaxis protein